MNYGKKGARDRQKKLSKTSRKVKSKCTVTAFNIVIICLLVSLVAIACTGIGIIKGIIDTAPDISSINVMPSGYSTSVYDNNGTEIETLVASGANRVYATIDEIPVNLQNAFVDIEDTRFYEHNGVDIKGIARAFVLGVKNGGHFSQGASTITQQLLKNAVFNVGADESTFAESLKRKIQEQYLALQLEKQMDKSEILEYYLNIINLGNNTLGVQAASNSYFGKSVSELSLSECAVIAAITQNPSKYNPIRHPDNNKERRLEVLDKMKKKGDITQAEYDEAIADSDAVYERIGAVSVDNEETSYYTYFVDELTQQVVDDLVTLKGYTENEAYNLVYRGGLSIYTTQDSTIQAIADEEFNNPENFNNVEYYSISYRLSTKDSSGNINNYSEQNLKVYFQNELGQAAYKLIYDSEEEALADVETFKAAMLANGEENLGESLSYTLQPQASMTIMDPYTGEVKAIVGGRGEKLGSLTLNRATDTTRQPGSTFKPLSVYSAALDSAGMSLASVIDEAPFYYKDGKPVASWDGAYKGLMDIRYAIAWSRNIPAVKLMTELTPKLGFDYLLKYGFTTLVSADEPIGTSHDVVQALPLGGITKGVTNLELTAAYAAIANNGTYTKPKFYTKILDHDGNVLIDNTEPETHTVIKESTAWLLTSALESVVNNGTGGRAAVSGQHVAGKTGTTSSSYDLWFSGYTPYYAGSVWLGYDDTSTLPNSWVSVAASTWSKVMTRIHEGLPTKEFEKPDDIVSVQICSQSGLLPVEGLCDCDPRGSCIKTEYFTKDTVPTEYCNTHVKVTVCEESGLPATDTCPNKVERIFIQKEGGKNDSTADAEYVLPDDYLSQTCNLHGGTAAPGTTTPEATTAAGETKPGTENTTKPNDTTKPSTDTTKPNNSTEETTTKSPEETSASDNDNNNGSNNTNGGVNSGGDTNKSDDKVNE